MGVVSLLDYIIPRQLNLYIDLLSPNQDRQRADGLYDVGELPGSLFRKPFPVFLGTTVTQDPGGIS